MSPSPALASVLRTTLAILMLMVLVLSSPARASAAEEVVREVRKETSRLGKSKSELHRFYSDQRYQPLWVEGEALRPGAQLLLDYLETSHLDGLEPKRYRPQAIARTLKAATRGSPSDLAKAEIQLSVAFSTYVQDLARAANSGMIYLEGGLAPSVPSVFAILTRAASAPYLEAYLERFSWMHPTYGPLRKAAAKNTGEGQHEMTARSLMNARALPMKPASRHILVDAATARLFMYEGDQVVGEMKVVVGKASEATPIMAGLIRFVMLNPYWNIPPDLVRRNVAPKVLSKGVSYLKAKRYQVLSDWTDSPRILDPATVDWDAVASGRTELRVRQLPGKDNAMGKVKFMFPNELGIYLHDTPEKELFHHDERQFSAGCVRLEDAAGLAKWMFGRKPVPRSSEPEQQVNLPEPIPVYITYLKLP
jgi:L,D-transpeptidase YcbB